MNAEDPAKDAAYLADGSIVPHRFQHVRHQVIATARRLLKAAQVCGYPVAISRFLDRL